MTKEKLLDEINRMKLDSEELAMMTTGAEGALKRTVGSMAQMLRGSHTGEDAVAAVQQAIHSLNQAAASMRTLGHICNDCIKYNAQ